MLLDSGRVSRDGVLTSRVEETIKQLISPILQEVRETRGLVEKMSKEREAEKTILENKSKNVHALCDKMEQVTHE
jgi:hypothetical protein